jgi:hypothetical protein
MDTQWGRVPNPARHYVFYAFFVVDHFFSFPSDREFLEWDLFYQAGFLSDLFHGAMLLAYFSEKFFWRRVILDYA